MEKEKMYVLRRNKTISWDKWVENEDIKKIYSSEKIEDLLKKIIDWYELKFSINDPEMTFDKLKKYKLTRSEENFLDCAYHSGIEGISFCKEEKEPKFENRILIYLPIKEQADVIAIVANDKGIIRGNCLDDVKNVLNISDYKINNIKNLYDLEQLLLQYPDKIKIDVLSDCLKKYQINLLARNEFIEYAIFKINNLDKKSDFLSNFIDEFNAHYYGINPTRTKKRLRVSKTVK